MILYMLGPDTRISDSFGQIHSLNTRVSTAITLHFRPKNRRLSLSLSLLLRDDLGRALELSPPH